MLLIFFNQGPPKMFNLKSLVAVLAFSVFSVQADSVNFEMKENIALSGKIATVKTSSKYKSVAGCQALCEKKNACAAFVLDSKAGKCSILKSVTNEVAKDGLTSGVKS